MWVVSDINNPTWPEIKLWIEKSGLTILQVAHMLGAPETIDNLAAAWDWLQYEDVADEVVGLLNYHFGKPPKIDRNELHEEQRNQEIEEHYKKHKTFERIPRAEWKDVVDLPVLAWGTPPTEQEERVGIMVRQFGKGQYHAKDLLGLNLSSWGGRPQEALAQVYGQMTGRIPYHASKGAIHTPWVVKSEGKEHHVG